MSSSLVRQLREEDADAVAALFVTAWGESRRMDGGEIREWVGNQALKPENLLVVEREGRVVAPERMLIDDPIADRRWRAVGARQEKPATGVIIPHLPARGCEKIISSLTP